MIAHVIPPRKSKDGDATHHRYSRLIKYLLDPQNKHERVGDVSIAHCHSADANVAAIEVEAVQSLNRRVEDYKKTYHLVISFPSGETPGREVLQAIEATIVDRLGYADHQRVSVVHHDTDHMHLHVAINKVHPTRRTCHTPKLDFRILGQACDELEKKYGLQQVNHTPNGARSQRAEDMERHSGIESLVTWARRECLADLVQAKSWQELHLAAAQHDLRVQLRGAGCVLVHGETAVRASSVARDLSLGKLIKRFGPFADAQQLPTPTTIAATPETRGGPSVDDEAAAPQIAQDAAAHGVASAVHAYAPRPVNVAGAARALFAQFQADRLERDARRQLGLNGLSASYRREVEAALRKAKLRRLSIKVFGRSRLTKRVMYNLVHRSLRKELDAIRQRHSQRRHDLYAGSRRSGWTTWLQQQANAGNAEALRALRARQGARPLAGDVVSGSAPARHRTPPTGAQTTKAGVLIYRVGNVIVREDAAAIRVGHGASTVELCDVLARAAQRHGPILHVEGAPEFRHSVARAAALSGLRVRFDDAALEQQRQSYRSDYERRQSSSTQQRQPGSTQPRRSSQPDAGRGGRAGAAGTDRVRDMPARDLAIDGQRGASVLPRDARLHVVGKTEKPDQTLRRPVPRVGDESPALRTRAAHQRNAVAEPPAKRPTAARRAAPTVGQPLPPHLRKRPNGEQPRPAQASPRVKAASARPSEAAPPRPVGRVGQNPPPHSHRYRLYKLSKQVAEPTRVTVTHQGSRASEPTQPRKSAKLVGRVGQVAPPVKSRQRLHTMAKREESRNDDAPVVTPAATMPARPQPTAVDAYVRERESKRVRGLDVPKHLPFGNQAGKYVFAGRRQVQGVELVLLQRGQEIFVLKTGDDAALWGQLRIGREVSIDGTGKLRRGRTR